MLDFPWIFTGFRWPIINQAGGGFCNDSSEFKCPVAMSRFCFRRNSIARSARDHSLALPLARLPPRPTPMSSPTKPDEPAFAFLTVMEDATAGMLGGLLVVNRRGRPVEFHCTAPINYSRAEEILFGPTLRPHFYCERIGAALLAKLSTDIAIVVVNQLDCWPIADLTAKPVVMVDPNPGNSGRVEVSGEADQTTGGGTSACLDQLDPVQRPEAERLLGELSRYVDLSEPFERIVEAIREAGLLGAGNVDPTADEEQHAEAA